MSEEPRIERTDGRWFMVVGGEASPMDGTVCSALNSKLARMTEAQRRSRALGQLAEMDSDLLPPTPPIAP